MSYEYKYKINREETLNKKQIKNIEDFNSKKENANSASKISYDKNNNKIVFNSDIDYTQGKGFKSIDDLQVKIAKTINNERKNHLHLTYEGMKNLNSSQDSSPTM